MTRKSVSVCVFAYNEAREIGAALDALGACVAEAELTVHVLINGCTDDTEAVVRAYRPRGFAVVPVVIERGDKANAWNHYTHEVAPAAAALHVFTDGDMRVLPGSVAGFLQAFRKHPEAWGCAGLPSSGRSRDAFREKLMRNHEMAGNLYALHPAAIDAFRDRQVRLPFGMFGEDGLVTMLVKCGLDPLQPLRDERITVSELGGFVYAPLSPWRLSDWRIYRNRKRRYAVRKQQVHMLYPLLRERGIGAMPEHVVDLYRQHAAALRFGWTGLDTWFDWEARQRIQRDIAVADAQAAKEEARAHLYS